MGQLKPRNLKGESMEMEQEYENMEQDEDPSDVDEVMLSGNSTIGASKQRGKSSAHGRRRLVTAECFPQDEDEGGVAYNLTDESAEF